MPGIEVIRVSAAVEGLLDEAVLRRLVREAGASLGAVYGKAGKTAIRQKLQGYNAAARFEPWVVLVDLDADAPCAAPLCAEWLPEPAPHMNFRVAVHAVEAWLLADRERAGAFLAVPATRIPRDPDSIERPKRFVVDLAARSRRRDIRMDMTPRPGTGRTVGPAYTSRMIEFVTDGRNGWRPSVAARHSESLARCLRRLTERLRTARVR
jgi:hypothetical protein